MSTKKNEVKNAPVVIENEVDVSEWTTISSVAGKSVYGHRLNTLASTMDDLIHAGKFTNEQIIQSMMKLAPKKPSESRARQALKAHIDYLGKGNNPGATKVIVRKNTGSKNPKMLDVIQAFPVSK